jgi:hypothetical protein
MPGPGGNTGIYANASNQSENISSVDMEIYLTVDDTLMSSLPRLHAICGYG